VSLDNTPVVKASVQLTYHVHSTLTGIPIAGEILARCNGEYWGLITFTICCYAAGLVCVTAVKLIHVGWRQPWAVY
jgi:hypothetical protein